LGGASFLSNRKLWVFGVIEMFNEIIEMKNKRNVEELFTLLQSDKGESEKDWMLRLDAAEALAQLGDKRGLDYLNKMIESSNKDIQDVASEILDGLKDFQPEPILQTQVHQQSNPNSLVYRIISKYPYPISWIAFLVLYFLAITVLAPVATLYWLTVPTWMPRLISSLILLLAYLAIGFFIFRYLIKKIILPHENKD
jgi:hypothetical protein